MTYIEQLPEGDLRLILGNQYETLLTASSQPPTPPIPPTPPVTPFDAYPPNPRDFGFYVSFRFDQFLQKKIGKEGVFKIWANLRMDSEKFLSFQCCGII
jgi:hypothetical protein